MHSNTEKQSWSSGKYWMVHNIDGHGAPNFRHPNKEQAVAEAKRLASESPNCRFVVLEAIEAFGVHFPRPPVRALEMSELTDDIPF